MLRSTSYSAGASSASQSLHSAGRSVNRIPAAVPTSLYLRTTVCSATGPAAVLGRYRPWMQTGLQRGRLAPVASAAATGGASPAAPPADGAASQLPPCPVYEHVIFPPLDSNTAPPESECLMVVAPGAFLPPAGFETLARAVQSSAPGLRLWVSVIQYDYMGLITLYGGPDALARGAEGFSAAMTAMGQANVYGVLMDQVLQQSANKGFVPRKEGPAGRLANLVVLCQSAGGAGYPSPASRLAAAMVLLAATPNPGELALHKRPSLEAWSRPLLILSGESDGQMRWPWQAPYLGELAAMAAKFGPGYASRTKPIIVVPGVNHGNTSNGVANTARGDITAGAGDHATCARALGEHIAHFLTAHLAITEQQQHEASGKLLEAVRQSMQHVAPYCTALGLGDVAAPFDSAAGAPSSPQLPYGPALAGGLVAGACRSVGLDISSALHPGIVSAAESAACAAQGQVLGALPQEARERVAVAATAHTSATTFLSSLPSMTPLGGGRWLLHVHVMLHYRSTDLGVPIPGIRPHAPEHWIKMKTAAHVAQVLGLPEPSRYPTPPPAALSRATLAAALAAVPREVAQRYEQYGRKVEPTEDSDTVCDNAAKWVNESRIAWAYPPAPATTAAPAPGAPPPPPPSVPPSSLPPVKLGCPYLLMPHAPLAPAAAPGGLPFDPASERFSGAFYVKVPSVAQLMEWVWLDSLRAMDTPW